MYKRLHCGLFIVAACMPGLAQARNRDILQPVQVGNESVRFVRGNYVIDLPGSRAVVEVGSAPSDHENLSFMVAVLNTGPAPINFGVGNIRVEDTESPVRLLTRAEMVHKAEHRAGWSKFFTALGGALTSGSQRETYDVSGVSSYGFFTAQVSAPCYGCEAASMALTDARLARIEGKLDATRGALAQQALQLTTVDPGQAYGGRIFLSKFKHESTGQMRLIVTVGGESFAFGFRFAPEGTPAPAYRVATMPPVSGESTMSTVASAPARASSTAWTGAVPVRASMVQSVPAEPRTTVQAPVRVAAYRVSDATRAKWRRYYDAAMATGKSKSEAKSMADDEFGSID